MVAAVPRTLLLLAATLAAVATADAVPCHPGHALRQASAEHPDLEAKSVESHSHRRVRRQNGEIVESIFQIPIQTLMAVSKAFTTSIQSIQRQREQFFQATGPRPTGGGGSSSSSANSLGSALYNNYQQPYKPYKPYRPSSSSSAAAASSNAGYASASTYAVLNKPGYVLYNYHRPRAAAPAAQSHAASVAGVAAQGDGSSYRI